MDPTLRRSKASLLGNALAAGVATGLCFVVADSVARSGWGYWPIGRHLVAAALLYLLCGTVFGLGVFGLTRAEAALTARLERRRPGVARWLRPSLYAIAAGLLSAKTAFWTFSGARARVSSYAQWGPYALITGAAASAGVVAWLVLRATRDLERRARWPLVVAGGLALLSGGLIAVDLSVYVALYMPLHAALELIAAILLTAGISIALAASTGGAVPRAVRIVAALGVGWTVLFVAFRPASRWLERSLRHVWIQPEYLGRMLRRVEIAEAFFQNPSDWRGLSAARVADLKERFDIASATLDPQWAEPFSEPADLRKAVQALRRTAKNYNILVYYVDTLRYDVSADRKTMPHVVAFAKHAIDFRRAYSCGSDTLRALPGLTGGRYMLEAGSESTDLLQVARRAGLHSVLAIPRSAREFLHKLRPSFHFDETLEVADYAAGRTDVWGYGADQPTARPLVDRSLAWLKAHDKERFLLWIFNFDQHNWRELNSEYVHGVAKKYRVPDQGALNWRYRVVATGIDSQFRRLLDGLRHLGLEKRTIVLFVADHGEAVGRQGFWVHSVFLWEGLVRVPLILRVPGLKPAIVNARVSLIDVPPTLVRYMQPDPDMDNYQGEDLISYLVQSRPPRRFPLLMTAASQDTLVRVGLLDPRAPWKLVLPLESGAPELYDLTAADPDAFSVADRKPAVTARLLKELLRSPVFPRAPFDWTAHSRVLAHSPP